MYKEVLAINAYRHPIHYFFKFTMTRNYMYFVSFGMLNKLFIRKSSPIQKIRGQIFI
jgi:hypothetical protein